MAKTLKTTIAIGGKIDKSFNNALKAAQSGAAKTAQKIGNSFKNTVANVGKVVAVGATAAAVAVGAFTGVAVKNAAELQTQMQNVATLLDGTEAQVKQRTKELSDEVIKVSNSTGIATADLTSGLYDVISAIGDTEDSIKVLEIAAKAAAAGNAETSESVALLTAVTKGYGDTSGEAFQKASDLAFTTVKLGQTTFPELAASIGKVTPLASALNVTQEELFGTFATLTGVTGSAAEVATQYKAVLSGLMTPSKQMGQALDALGFSTGSAAIESLGFEGVLKQLMGTVDGDTQKMAKLFSSVEAQTAILALCGAQADTYSEKLKAMGQASGATDAAFATQTDNIEYMMQRIKNLGTNFATSVGQKILPYVMEFAEAALPVVQSALENALPYIDLVVEKAQPIIGFLKDVGSMIASVMPDVMAKLKDVAGAIGPIIENIAGKIKDKLPQAIEIWKNNFENVTNFVVTYGPKIASAISGIFEKVSSFISTYGPVVTEYFSELWEKIQPYVKSMGETLMRLFGDIQKAVQGAMPIFQSAASKIMPIIQNIANIAQKVLPPLMAYLSALFSILGKVVGVIVRVGAALLGLAFDAIATKVQNFTEKISQIANVVGPVFEVVFGKIGEFFNTYLPGIFDGIAEYFTGIVATLDGILNRDLGAVVDGAKQIFSGVWDTLKAGLQPVLDFIRSSGLVECFKSISEDIKAVFNSLNAFISDVFKGDWESAWKDIVGVFEGIFNGIKDVVRTVLTGVVSGVNSMISGINLVSGKVGLGNIPLIQLPAFAKGDTVTSPTIALVGEAGPETIVPHNNTPRSRELLNQAAKGVYGSDAGTPKPSSKKSGMVVNYAPVINGGGDSIKDELEEDFRKFKQYFERLMAEDDREVFA